MTQGSFFVAQAAAPQEPRTTVNPGEAREVGWFRLTSLADDATVEPPLRRMVTLSADRFSNNAS